jgi:hypothetical protein
MNSQKILPFNLFNQTNQTQPLNIFNTNNSQKEQTSTSYKPSIFSNTQSPICQSQLFTKITPNTTNNIFA